MTEETHQGNEALRLSFLGAGCPASADAALDWNQSSAGSLQAVNSHKCFAPLPPGPARRHAWSLGCLAQEEAAFSGLG